MPKEIARDPDFLLTGGRKIVVRYNSTGDTHSKTNPGESIPTKGTPNMGADLAEG